MPFTPRRAAAAAGATLALGLASLPAVASQASSSAPPAPTPLQQVLFSAAVADAYGARCLDGSVAGYYFAPGTGSGASSFAIFLEGGGACYTPTDCGARAKTALGSSLYWSSTYTDTNNVLSSDPAVNPFATFAKVYVPYCSGDVHTGTLTAVVSPSAFPYRFSGHRIVAAVLDALLNTTSIATADNVLLSGSSAGGIGTFANADFVSDRLGPGVKRYRTNPQGGWFFPQVVNYTAWMAGATGPPYDGESPALLGLWQPYLHPNCVAAFNATYCLSVGNFFPFVRALTFTTENLADSNQIFVQNGAPANASSPTVVAYVQYSAERMRASVVPQVTARAGDGLFLMACLAHTENTYSGSPTVVNKTRLVDALGSWFFGKGDGVQTRLADTCGPTVPCNPTCPKTTVGGGEGGGEGEGGDLGAEQWLEALAAEMPAGLAG
jgi:hypothetical protein